jgi:hypothetical protein
MFNDISKKCAFWFFSYCHATINEVCIGNRSYWTRTLVTTNNYMCLTVLHTLKITIITKNIKYSQTSLTVTWQRLPTADVPLPLGFRTIPGINYQLVLQLSTD